MQHHVQLRSLNTMHISAEAQSFITVSNHEILQQIIIDKLFDTSNTLILGGGSNILFTRNYEGLILKNDLKGILIEEEDNDHCFVRCGGGESWHKLVMFSVEKDLGGIENLSLIPGTAGAAPIQNIGAYGIELKNTLYTVEAVHMHTGETRIFTNTECKFGYRDSIFKSEYRNLYFITAIVLKLNKRPVFHVSYGAIRDTLEKMNVTELSVKAISDAVIHIRRNKLPDPDVLGNAGSFFKNPEILTEQFEKLQRSFPSIPGYPAPNNMIKVAAGWLIEQCGWKGKRIGDTGAHADQALVLVNYGNATGNEIFTLAKEIQKSVRDKFDIQIQTEVNII